MPPMKLNYGLNVPKKNKTKIPAQTAFAAASSAQKRKKTIFGDDFEDENDDGRNKGTNEAIEITTFGSVTGDEPSAAPAQKQPRTEPARARKPDIPSSKGYVNLSSLRSSKKYAEEAQELDPSVYDYDAVYDSLHAAPEDEKKKTSSEGPKYIKALLRSAEVRKRDQLRARERMLQREREAEGDEYADKEKFVTSAYKAQQEEARRLEEEEEKRAREEEERRKRGAGMVGFYKDMLKKDEERHETVVRAAQEIAEKRRRGEVIKEPVSEDATAQEESEARRLAALNAMGAHIAINEEGEVVDKRQLLSAGLNVAPKKKPATAAEQQSHRDQKSARPGYGLSGASHGRGAGPRTAQRERQTEMLAAQLEEKMRAQHAEEEAKQKELAEKNKSHRSATDVQIARERYLARKREREMASKQTQ
ncbi:hypothetical protein KEM54_003731 [Ascosphaera aggregata]|nr:hypothetical protein KEM54_003731 [Ascosphaera aggregata]